MVIFVNKQIVSFKYYGRNYRYKQHMVVKTRVKVCEFKQQNMFTVNV